MSANESPAPKADDVYAAMENTIRKGFKDGVPVAEIKVTGRRLAKQRFGTPLEQAEAWLHFISSLRDMVCAEMERIEAKGFFRRYFSAKYRVFRDELMHLLPDEVAAAERAVGRAAKKEK